MKIVSLEDHCYQSPDRESVKRNTKDAKKNKKFLGHLPLKQVTPPKRSLQNQLPQRTSGLDICSVHSIDLISGNTLCVDSLTRLKGRSVMNGEKESSPNSHRKRQSTVPAVATNDQAR